MKKLLFPAMLVALAMLALVLLAGCGGGSSIANTPSGNKGSVSMAIDWPAGGGSSSRTIPAGANSISVTLQQTSGGSYSATEFVNKPNTVLEFMSIPVGTYTVSATAWSNPGGTGTAMAGGITEGVVVLSKDTTEVGVTLVANLLTLDFGYASSTLKWGPLAGTQHYALQKLFAVYDDGTNEVEVPITPATLVNFSTSNAPVATVDAEGVVTPYKTGSATITATFSGVTQTTTLTFIK